METLIRYMMDLDSWIVSIGDGQATGLSDSLRLGEGGGEYTPAPPPSPYQEESRNPKIMPFMSGAHAGTIPAEILPLETKEERASVGTLLTELNENSV